jgi:hypothetical protein
MRNLNLTEHNLITMQMKLKAGDEMRNLVNNIRIIINQINNRCEAKSFSRGTWSCALNMTAGLIS